MNTDATQNYETWVPLSTVVRNFISQNTTFHYCYVNF